MAVQVDLITLAFLLVAIILAAFLLPMIWQIKMTAQEIEKLAAELRRDLSPVLQDLNESMERVNRITAKVEKGTDKTENLVETLDNLAGSLHHAVGFVRHDMYRYAEMAGVLLAGIKAASKTFSQNSVKKETDS